MIPQATHGGIIHTLAREQGQKINRLIDFSASINPLGLSPQVRRAIQQTISQTVHYPDVDGQPLRTQLARIHRLSEDCLVIGNGSAELISVLPRALGSRHGLVIGPTFMEFERALTLAGAQCSYVHAKRDENYQYPIARVCKFLKQTQSRLKKKSIDGMYPIDTVFLCHPNSPTGQVLAKKQLHELLELVQKVGARLIVDEAFIDYCSSHSVLKHIGRIDGLIVLRSFTKFYAIPGLRIGYLGGPADVVEKIRSLLPPWSVNILASAAAVAALQDTIYRKQSLQFMTVERKRFRALLNQLPGLRLFPASANFLLVEIQAGVEVEQLTQALRRQGLLIRDCQNFAGIENPTIRLAVRCPNENDRLVKALKRELAQCQ
ncbi:MAG: threonine-phosphate decarboxylase CobD [Nitrospirales bacterium]